MVFADKIQNPHTLVAIILCVFEQTRGQQVVQPPVNECEKSKFQCAVVAVEVVNGFRVLRSALNQIHGDFIKALDFRLNTGVIKFFDDGRLDFFAKFFIEFRKVFGAFGLAKNVACEGHSMVSQDFVILVLLLQDCLFQSFRIFLNDVRLFEEQMDKLSR